MTVTTETDVMIEVNEALLTLSELKAVFLFQYTPVDRSAFMSPTACVYFEEDSVESRNRVDMITGILHIEVVWIADSARQSATFWQTLVGLKARIQGAIYGRQELVSKLARISRIPAKILSVNDDELHLIQQYRLTFGTAAHNLSTQTIQ